ncbi:MAG: DUF4189 domain-containing protein, partial [Lysobacter sp.]
ACTMAVLMVGCADARSEGGCPAGQIPHQGASTISCGPIPTRSGENQEPIWGDRWGAIASSGVDAFGISEQRRRKSEARKLALEECRQRGGRACELHFVYKNQCAVVIYSATRAFSQSAESQDIAGALAMRECENSGGGECRVYYSGCSLPVRVQ